ncbi:SDR family NAD(P)-dependent oxidoreductase, partial [Streptomyces sp. MCAF7]
MSASTTPGPAAGATTGLGGRTALVTGAAGGIGRACTLRLAAAGATVLAVDQDEKGLAELAALAARTEAAPRPPGRVEARALDLTDLDAAERAAEGVDILVNNAGL